MRLMRPRAARLSGAARVASCHFSKKSRLTLTALMLRQRLILLPLAGLLTLLRLPR